MAKQRVLHPLDKWLKDHDIKAYVFAEKHNLSVNSIYAHMRGAVKNPGMRLCQKIEAATGGEVTTQAQAEWFLVHAGQYPRRDHGKPVQADLVSAPDDDTQDAEAAPDEPEDPDEPGDENDEGPREDTVDDPGPKIVPF